MKDQYINEAKTVFLKFKSINKNTSQELIIALRDLFNHSKSENGILMYEVFKSKTNALEFYVRETWEDEQAWYTHVNQPHIKKFIAISDKLLAVPLEVTILESPVLADWYINSFIKRTELN